MSAFQRIKNEFENQLKQLLAIRKERTLLMTDKRYNEVLQETKEALERRRCGLELSGLYYRRLKRFDVKTINGREKLIQRNEYGNGSSRTIQYCRASEMFEVVHYAHLKIGHKKEKGMEMELKKVYCNITREVTAIYLKLCETCALKKKYKEKTLCAKEDAVPNDLSSRCQIDIIDVDLETDEGYRYILNYQDHVTKFLILRPLRTNSAAEIAEMLFDIFCLIGIPNVLLCSNENGLCEKILRYISENWNVKLVRGDFKPETIQRISQDILRTIAAWISQNQSNNWVPVLRIIQNLKNRCFHPSIKHTPFEALFGNRYSNSLLDKNLNLELETENDLKAKIVTFRQTLNEVAEIRKEITKSHDEALRKNCDTKPNRCLNCSVELVSEVFCWKCNGPLHFNCALTNDNSENSFCRSCASKTALHVIDRDRKPKLSELEDSKLDILHQTGSLISFEDTNIGNSLTFKTYI